MLTRLGRIAKIVALLAFLLPWVTVSCAGQQIASVTGADLARGVMTVRNPETGALVRHAGSANWAMLLAALAILLALLVGMARVGRLAGRTGTQAGLLLSLVAAALSLYAVLVDIPNQLLAGAHRQEGGADSGAAGDLGASLARSIEHIIRVDPAIGFWISILALAAACGLDLLVLRRRAVGG